MPKYSLKRSEDWDLMKDMSDRMLGKGVWQRRDKEAFWVLWCGDRPAGFCAIADIGNRTGYFTAAAVEPWARGDNLQRRMIRVRKQWARHENLKSVITYTVPNNYPSIVNLIKAGFKFYDPEYAWVGKGMHYFQLNL